MRHVAILCALIACGGSSKPPGAGGSNAAKPSCDESVPVLVSLESGPAGAPDDMLEVLESGFWRRTKVGTPVTGCTTGAQLAALTDLVAKAQPKIVSSDQRCPKAETRHNTLIIRGKPPLAWGDGGCGTEIDATSTAILAQLSTISP